MLDLTKADWASGPPADHGQLEVWSFAWGLLDSQQLVICCLCGCRSEGSPLLPSLAWVRSSSWMILWGVHEASCRQA